MKEEVLNSKKALVDEIKENIENAKSMVILDYRGLDVAEVTELRSKYREEDVVYKVYKNTMMNFAFKDLGYDEFLDYLSGPNAVAFSLEDPIAAARVSKKFSDDHENLVIKAGYLGDKFLDKEAVERIAKIPSREELLAKLLGSLKSPVTDFVYLINAIKEKKEEEEGAPEEAEGAEESEETAETEETEETAEAPETEEKDTASEETEEADESEESEE